MDDKFLGVLCEKDGCCHCHGAENCLLSYHVIIHKRASWEKALMLMISLFLRVVKV
jgi:hypothetical protein